MDLRSFSTPERSERIANQARKAGIVLLIAGAAAPSVLRRWAAFRASLQREVTPFHDEPGSVMKLIGARLLHESDRRRASSANSGA
jgi:hypothetical protein